MSNFSALKIRGWAQTPRQISSTRNHEVGEVRYTADGRAFIYAKDGGSGLSTGKLACAKAIDSDVVNKTGSAVAIGERQMTLTITAANPAIAENEFANGFLHINDGTAAGDSYKIESNTAVALNGTSITLTLAEPIRGTALTTSSEFTLVHNPAYGVSHTTTQASTPVGVPLVDVPANYYAWLQCLGVAAVLIDGTPAVGSKVTISTSVSGAVKVFATAEDPVVGVMFGTAGVNGEYKPVRLCIGH